MSEKDLTYLFMDLVNLLPNYVREMVELCLYHDDPNYSSCLANSNGQIDDSSNLLALTIHAISEWLLRENSLDDIPTNGSDNNDYVSPDCKC